MNIRGVDKDFPALKVLRQCPIVPVEDLLRDGKA
jgi:hypothetical protein